MPEQVTGQIPWERSVRRAALRTAVLRGLLSDAASPPGGCTREKRCTERKAPEMFREMEPGGVESQRNCGLGTSAHRSAAGLGDIGEAARKGCMQ